MTWLGGSAPGASTPLDAVFGLVPTAYARFRELYGGLWDPGAVDPRVLELCRLRIATVLGCDAERAVRYTAGRDAGLTEADVEALPRWYEDDRFGPGARAAVGFAEQYVIDPHGLTDEHFTALHAQFDERALATVTLAVAMFDALTRFRLALGVEPVAPVDEPELVPGPALEPASLP